MIFVRNCQKYLYGSFRVEEVEADYNAEVDGLRIGIDPGTVHLGIAIVAPERAALLYEVTMRRDNDPVKRMVMVQDVLRQLLHFLPTDGIPLVIVEGASFADRFRQVELAEQRTAIALWMMQFLKANIIFVPPTRIVKAVFGNGKTAAWKEWSHLPHNAASAMACALYPIDIKASSI